MIGKKCLLVGVAVLFAGVVCAGGEEVICIGACYRLKQGRYKGQIICITGNEHAWESPRVQKQLGSPRDTDSVPAQGSDPQALTRVRARLLSQNPGYRGDIKKFSLVDYHVRREHIGEKVSG